MNKYIRILVMVISVPVLAYVAYFIYLMWPSFFPKYAVDSCVIDSSVQRIHKIKGFDDRYKGSGVPTEIVASGTSVPGTFLVGSKASMRIDDPNISPIACP